MALITCKDLSVGYDSNAIIKNLDFTVDIGNYLCIVGENGAGKSTLMKTLLGLIKPLEGEIILGDGLTRNEIGYLPQKTVVQTDFPASVKEIVMSGFQKKSGLRPFYSREEKEYAQEQMELLGIADMSKRCFRELSGGQQQRVLLARALCAATKLLILDEPVAGLDPKVTAQMYALIKDLNDIGVTMIMVSHDIVAAAQYASHILHIGKKKFFGRKNDYINSDVGKFFIGEDVIHSIPAFNASARNVETAVDPSANAFEASGDPSEKISGTSEDAAPGTAEDFAVSFDAGEAATDSAHGAAATDSAHGAGTGASSDDGAHGATATDSAHGAAATDSVHGAGIGASDDNREEVAEG